MLKRLATLLCCLPLMASAAQVTDLYQGKAPTSGDMTAAQAQALGDVLVKVTGKRDILAQPDVVKALAAPGDYVQHYGYQDVGPVKFLKADFDVAKVNALVAQSKFALLGPVLWPDPAAQDLAQFLADPSWQEPLGRDQMGRSLMARLAAATDPAAVLKEE